MGILLNLLSFILIEGITFCNCEVCLSWSIYNNQLRLSCQIDNHELEVSFYDPLGQEQAVCLMSYPTPICHSHSRNGSISRTESQRKTVIIFTLSGNIDKRINGMWTCLHGNNYEQATTLVTTDPLTDVASPSIKTNQSSPFVNGTVVEFACIIETSGHAVNLEWNCFNVSSYEEQVINCTKHVSTLSLEVSTFLSGKICTCTARINNFGLTAQIKLDVQSRPVLELLEEFICYTSSNISLSCSVYGTTTYTFAPWIHSYNGTFIRYIRGVLEDNVSTILIKACSFEDAGQYTCSLWMDKFDEKLAINRSSMLYVLGSPNIISTHINISTSTRLSAIFLSFPPPHTIAWYMKNTRVVNSSRFTQMYSHRTFLYQMHETVVKVNGYVSSMVIEDEQINVLYENVSVFLQNDVGNASYFFVTDNGRRAFYVFNISILTWILVLTVVFIITVVGTCILVTKWNQEHQVSLERRIYYAAPQHDNQDERNTAASNYVEINTNSNYLEATDNLCEDDLSEHYIYID